MKMAVRFFYVCFLGLLITLSLACNSEATNLLSNGDFETGDLTSWTSGGLPLSGSIVLTTAAHNGIYGLWTYTAGDDSTEESYSFIYQNVNASSGDVFDASAYIRTPQPGPGVDWVDGSYACVRVTFLSALFTPIATYDSPHLTTGDTPYAGPCTIRTPPAPMGTNYVRFTCYIYEPAGVPNRQSVANFDDCSLEKQVVTIVSPPEGSLVSNDIIQVVGSVTDLTIEAIDLNGNPVNCFEGRWEVNLWLAPGENIITATAVDGFSNVWTDTVTITYDPNTPTGLFDVIYPVEGTIFYETPALVTATLSSPSDLYININGKEYIAVNGIMTARVPIAPGDNILELRCHDQSGYEEVENINITFNTDNTDLGGAIANNGFENSGYPQRGWVRWNGSQSFDYADGSAPFLIDTVSRSGSQSSGQVLYGAAARWGGIGQEFPVTPGDIIDAEGYLASFTGDDPLAGGAEAYIEIGYITNRGNRIESYISNKITGATEDWVRLSVSSIVPYGAETAIFAFSQFGPAGATGKVYFDDAYVDVIPGSEPPGQGDPPAKPKSTGPVQISGRTILLNGEPFTIKGVSYQPIPISYDVTGYDVYSDPNIYNRDLPLLRHMGVNTIRTYGRVTSTGFLDACYNNGVNPIYVIMGFFIDGSTDLSNPTVRGVIKDDFQVYVNTYKSHPAVLMWSPGNETEYAFGGHIRHVYTLLNELAEVAYIEEGESYHPVTAVLMNIHQIDDNGLLSTDSDMDYLDAWGANVYEGITFGDMFDDFVHRSEKLFWISEFGIDAYHVDSAYFDGEQHVVQSGHIDEQLQADWAESMVNEILASDVAAGCTLMSYSDEWWKAGDPFNHDNGGARLDTRSGWVRFPDGFMNEEYWGVVEIAPDGTWPEEPWNEPGDGVDDIKRREIYFTLKDIYKERRQGCFLAGTPILMSDKTTKPIEHLRVGDELLAFDEDTGELKHDTVKHVFVFPREEEYLVINSRLKVTPTHMFAIWGQVCKNPSQEPRPVPFHLASWVSAGQLKTGDMLLNAKGEPEAIASIKRVKESVTVYNIEVNPYHTFIAGGVVVHNARLRRPQHGMAEPAPIVDIDKYPQL